MPRQSSVRPPRRDVIDRLRQQITSEGLRPTQRRRIEVLLLHAQGMTAVEIASTLDVHPNTVYGDLHKYQAEGLKRLTVLHRRGAKSRFSSSQLKQIARIADQTPTELGLRFGRWSLNTLRAYLIHKRIISRISREHLRCILKKRG